MCIVSAVHTAAAQFPDNEWNREIFQKFLDLKKQAEEFDKITKQPDCVDPAKEQLVKDILKYLEDSGKLK
jgi:hypothetical protein